MSKLDLYKHFLTIGNEDIRWMASCFLDGKKPTKYLRGLKALLDGGHDVSSVGFFMPRDRVMIDGVICHAEALLHSDRPFEQFRAMGA